MGKKKKQTATYYTSIRSIGRGVAKAQLKKGNFVKTCKKEHPCLSPKLMRQMGRLHHIPAGQHRSWFANHWRTVLDKVG